MDAEEIVEFLRGYFGDEEPPAVDIVYALLTLGTRAARVAVEEIAGHVVKRLPPDPRLRPEPHRRLPRPVVVTYVAPCSSGLKACRYAKVGMHAARLHGAVGKKEVDRARRRDWLRFE